MIIFDTFNVRLSCCSQLSFKHYQGIELKL
jgi:hypothetical protein